jgi:hypothetical protein
VVNRWIPYANSRISSAECGVECARPATAETTTINTKTTDLDRRGRAPSGVLDSILPGQVPSSFIGTDIRETDG